MSASTPKKFVFAGGGTGGHLYPAIALAQELQRRLPTAAVHFVGTARGIEARVIPQHGFPLHLIAVRGARRSSAPANLLLPFVLAFSLLQSLILLIRLRPAAVIGTGGYVSGPVLLTAALLGLPTIIQEQNSRPGVTTRMLARIASRVHISFDVSRRWFRGRRLWLSGNPVRAFDPSISPAQARTRFGLSPQRMTLLVFGGSQGAQALNAAVLGSLSELFARVDLQVLWSTGKGDFAHISKAVEPFGERVRVLPFIDDMEGAYRAADLAVTRSGALTLAELTLCGLPAVLVPFPYAAANHQEANARALEACGAALVILQKSLTPNVLTETVGALLCDAHRRARMSEAAKKAAFPHAARDIVDSILEVTERKE